MRGSLPIKRGTSAGSGVKVFAGLSGGVDSAVAAALLQKEGYDVTGVFIRIALEGYPCSAGDDRLDAMRAAAHLKIPFVEIDLSHEYRDTVFRDTITQFRAGRTPNPDALCNREIKFGAFFDFARSRGAEYVATGHYARTRDGRLFAGADPDKDQSYFLWMVPGDVLRRTLFPVGGLHKTRLRELAAAFGLPYAARKDSQGLCFLGDVSIEDMLRRELTLVPGDVLDEAGEVIGRHEGAPAYTLGQRHGFTLFAHPPTSGAHTPPHYVIGKDAEFNTITVSASRFPRGARQTDIMLASTNWISGAAAGDCKARYRYRQQLIPARLNTGANRVVLLEPHYVPPGQSLVAYRDDECLGGGIVDKPALTE